MGFRIRRLIRAGTFVRLAISIVLATIIWGFIVWETNPEITREFQNIAVTAEDVPADMIIVGGMPSVAVTLKGPEDDLRSLVPSDVTASVSFATVDQPGIDEYGVIVDAPSAVRKIIVEPSNIEVELDIIVTRTFPIELREETARPASVTSIDISADTASILGPQDQVDRVAAVVLPVDLEGRDESFNERVSIQAIGDDGTVVEDIELSPASADLTVTFEQTSRDVPVTVICACVIDDRLEEVELVTAAAIPSTIRLAGPSSDLADISEVRTVPVDISGLDESGWILDVELDALAVAETVSMSDLTVDVWVPIAPSRMEIADVPIEVIGLGDNLELEISDETVFVVVTGSDRALVDPQALDVKAIVDLTGLSSGSFAVNVSIAVPPGISYEQVSPETVDVILRPQSTTANRLRDIEPESEDGVR